MRLAVAATPEVALPTLEWLLNSEHQLVKVITQPDRPAGRGRNLRESAVAQWANEHQIPVVKIAQADDLPSALTDVDLVVTIAFGILIPESTLSIPQRGFINVHFSALPALRGAAPVQRAILQGDTQIGISIFQLDKGMDTGPVYSTSVHEIAGEENSGQLLDRLSPLVPRDLDRVLSMISAGSTPITQSGAGTLAPKISKEEAKIDWSQSSKDVINLVRAFTPAPGAWTLWRGEKFHINESKSSLVKLPAGEIALIEGSLLAGCGDSAIEITTVIPFGKSAMKGADWARGARLVAGDHFE